MDGPPDKATLTELQSQPLALPTFVMHFLQWIAQDCDNIARCLQDEFKQFRASGSGTAFAFERQRTSCFILETGLKLLLRFIYATGALTDAEYGEWCAYVNGFVHDLYSCQITLATKHKSLAELDYAKVIAEAYYQCLLPLTSYRNAKCGIVFGFEYMAVNALCFDPAQLTEFLQSALSNCDIRREHIGKSLSRAGLLISDGEENSTKQFAYGKDSKQKHRYFFIRLSELAKYCN
jgi:hypothetical protein